MMNTKQRILDEEKFKDFVGDFNKFYKRDAEKIKMLEKVFGEITKNDLILNSTPENRL